MNDQSQMMNQAQMMGLSQGPVMKQAQMMSQGPMMNQPQIMSQPPMMSQMAQSSQPQLLTQSQAMAAQQQQQPQLMMMSSQSQPPMMNRGYKVWPQQQQKQSLDPNMKFQNSMKPNFGASSKLGRNNWKGKKGTDKRQDPRRMENPIPNASMSGPTSSGGYKPPTLHELQSQNRLKARKFYPKKKFNNRFAPYAPRNTTSFIIRAKKSGGIASLVSPCPVTPAVLPTPIFSPSREVLGDMAKEEWGVDGYGSMKGLIRLRSPGNEDEEDEEGGGGSSESDVEEHVEVERRLDHDLSRFEMIYPNYTGVEYNNVLENRVDDQDTHIAQLEEENLTLKERLFLMERDMADMRRRLQFLERQNHIVQDVNEEVVENESENESEGGSGAPDMFVVSGNRGSRSDDGHTMKENNGDNALEIERRDVCMDDLVHHEEVSKEKDVKHEEEKTRKENECDKGLTRKENECDIGFVGKEENKGDEAKTEPIFDETMVGKEETKGDEAKTELILDDLNEEEAKMEILKSEESAEQKEEMGISCSEKRGD